MTTERPAPRHPGEVLEGEFMRSFGLSANTLARAIDVPVTRVSEILRGRRGITADTALRLARFLGTTPEHWLVLQAAYDLHVAYREAGAAIENRVVPLEEAASISPRLFVRESRSCYGVAPVSRPRDRRRATRPPRSARELAAHIRELENRVDLRRARKALKERGSVPWKAIKADLGL